MKKELPGRIIGRFKSIFCGSLFPTAVMGYHLPELGAQPLASDRLSIF